ncbi:MAG: T9SS type A sorting domain-containing protein [Flavobacteriales bacterium]|nr:T9SS type A sorting domain-containing protein [Flavobacteriales bacterium]
MKRTLLSFVALMLIFSAYGQINYKRLRVAPTKTVRVDPLAPRVDYSPQLITLEKPTPGKQLSEKELAKWKADARFGKHRSSGTELVDTAARPILVKEWPGNSADGIPNDNSMAVSENGYLIAVINSRIRCHDLYGDSTLWQSSLGSFCVDLGFGNSKYDPRAVYDPVANRFIAVWLNGFTYETSQIIIAVSASEDPSDEWLLYSLPGNPLENDTWSDYPHISISTHDLYITFNTFLNGSSNNSGYVESTFWQIPLPQMYDGTLTETNYYYDMEYGGITMFNHTGVQGGSALYGPDFYLLNTRNLDPQNDTVFLVHVTDHGLGDPDLEITPVIMDEAYGLPPEGRQEGSSTFDTNDGRVQDAFYENDQIQFVLNSRDFGNNSAGIYHGGIKNVSTGNYETWARTVSRDSLDLAYSSLTYTGKSFLENDAMLTFLYSGEEQYASFGAIYFDNQGRYSEITPILEGNGIVNVLTSIKERWGDYTGAQRDYNVPGAVWATGSYGRSGFGKTTGTRAAHLHAPTIDDDPTLPNETFEGVLFPNPSQDHFEMEFTLASDENLTFEIVSVNGQFSDVLLRRFTQMGVHRFSFDTAHLSAGSYVLIVTDGEGNQVKRERVIVLK